MDLVAAKLATLPDKIKAGLASPEMNSVTSLLRASGLECRDLPMRLGDLDAQLSGTRTEFV